MVQGRHSSSAGNPQQCILIQAEKLQDNHAGSRWAKPAAPYRLI